MNALQTAIQMTDYKDVICIPDHVAIVYDYIFSNSHDFESAADDYRICFLNVGYSYSSCIIAKFKKVGCSMKRFNP